MATPKTQPKKIARNAVVSRRDGAITLVDVTTGTTVTVVAKKDAGTRPSRNNYATASLRTEMQSAAENNRRVAERFRGRQPDELTEKVLQNIQEHRMALENDPAVE